MNYKAIVVITGVGLKEAKKRFITPDPATIIKHHNKDCKMNAAAGTAVILNKNNYLVYMIGSCQDCLERIGDLMNDTYHYKEADLLDKAQVTNIVKELATIKKETNLNIHIVHYGGASDTKTKLPNDNLFLDPWETPTEAFIPILANNTVTLMNLLQEVRPLILEQEQTKLIILSAITAIRTKKLHALDATQKGALHALARSLALDLTKERIYITEIMPGITDTGFYDNDATLNAIMEASREFGYNYTEETFPVFSAERVGEAALFALSVNAHVREISLIPYGQYPHLGA